MDAECKINEDGFRSNFEIRDRSIKVGVLAKALPCVGRRIFLRTKRVECFLLWGIKPSVLP